MTSTLSVQVIPCAQVGKLTSPLIGGLGEIDAHLKNFAMMQEERNIQEIIG